MRSLRAFIEYRAPVRMAFAKMTMRLHDAAAVRELDFAGRRAARYQYYDGTALARLHDAKQHLPCREDIDALAKCGFCAQF